MNTPFTKIILAIVLALGFTAPAYAQWDHHDFHRSRAYWGEPGPGVVVVEPAPPVVVVPAAPVVVYNTNQPYVRVRCTNGAAITGTVIGGVAGGLIGSQFGHHHRHVVPVVGGTLIGALIGGEIGAANETCAAQALEYGAPNTQVVWTSGGNNYVVEPVKTYQENGQYCREYQTKVQIGGQVQEGYGTACRQPDGSWKEIN